VGIAKTTTHENTKKQPHGEPDSMHWLRCWTVFGFGKASFDSLTLMVFEFWDFAESEERASNLPTIGDNRRETPINLRCVVRRGSLRKQDM
jgi:hypothetical protein